MHEAGWSGTVWTVVRRGAQFKGSSHHSALAGCRHLEHRPHGPIFQKTLESWVSI